jgi:hypothetical protein
MNESHPWVKHLARVDLLIAGIGTDGLIAEVEYLAKEDAAKLFKIQESNHSNFPQVNWNAPVWKINEASAAFRNWQMCPIDDVKRRVSLLLEACAESEISEEQPHMLVRLRKFSRQLHPRFSPTADPEFAAFPVLIERILLETVPPDEWVRSLSSAVLTSAEQGLIPLKLVEALLGGDLTRDDREAKVAILFDLADCTTFRCRVASPRMGGFYSRRLNATETGGGPRGQCALSGLEMPLETEKMPSPRLPTLGDTVLMSMNPDTPCQARYHRIGMDVFPLGKETANALNTALVHLTNDDREGKNWKRMPGTTPKQYNLLLIYLESAPMLEAAIAEMFTGGDRSEARYAALCAEVCEALRGRAARDSDLLRLFVLKKIDPGRVQVELSEAFTAGQVIQGGSEWQEGAKNRPLLPLEADDFVPSPAEVMRCLQMSWKRGGASYWNAPGARLADVYDVLLAGRSGVEDAAKALLRLTSGRTSDLLMAIGHAAHRGSEKAWKGIAREGLKTGVIAVSVLGITLRKLGYRKEAYMQEPAFLIGRFLSLADTLHTEYCKGVRKGDMPPQLLGNALMPTAMCHPNKGLARMLQRVRVYQAWARGKNGTVLARWSCAEMGKIANEVAGKLPDLRLSEAQQAQLLLGYLARTEKASEQGAQE